MASKTKKTEMSQKELKHILSSLRGGATVNSYTELLKKL